MHAFKESILGTGSGSSLGQGCAWHVPSNEVSLRRASEAMRSEADNKGAGLETHSRDIELGHVSLRGKHCSS